MLLYFLENLRAFLMTPTNAHLKQLEQNMIHISIHEVQPLNIRPQEVELLPKSFQYSSMRCKKLVSSHVQKYVTASMSLYLGAYYVVCDSIENLATEQPKVRFPFRHCPAKVCLEAWCNVPNSSSSPAYVVSNVFRALYRW
jgi:hypothetical protein